MVSGDIPQYVELDYRLTPQELHKIYKMFIVTQLESKMHRIVCLYGPDEVVFHYKTCWATIIQHWPYIEAYHLLSNLSM